MDYKNKSKANNLANQKTINQLMKSLRGYGKNSGL